MMRTTITQDGFNRATVTYDDPITGERREDSYYAPMTGGYVRTGEGKQVCDGLGRRGNTLVWHAQKPLVHLIRREYRRQQRELKRQGIR